MAQFIALVRRDLEHFKDEDFTPLLEPEAERVRQLYTQGVLRCIWSRRDSPGAVLLLEAGTLDEAHGLIATLPLQQKGMLFIDSVIPLLPYRGFAPRS